MIRREDGFTLPEMLLAITLMIVVIGATLVVLDGYGSNVRRNALQNDAEAAARTASTQLARDLRNAGAPGETRVLERTTGSDLVFKGVDPLQPGSGANTKGVRRVRYCLDTVNSRIVEQVQTWATAASPTLPTATACPDAAFGTATVLVSHVVNGTRPVFAFDSSTPDAIDKVTVDLFVDEDPRTAPSEVELLTGVRIRNQNRAPSAGFSATVLGNRHVLLNGGASVDPDGQQLRFAWYDGTTPIGTSPILDYVSPTAGAHSFTLTVTDTGGLSAAAPAQTVTVT